MSTVATAVKARVFEVGVRGKDWARHVLAISAGKAKFDYWREINESWPDVKYTDITCRLSRDQVSATARFSNTAAYRQVPFARIGMRVEVDGTPGVIAGSNDSANFDILFLDGPFKGRTGNCHPNWMMKYFDEGGSVIKEYKG